MATAITNAHTVIDGSDIINNIDGTIDDNESFTESITDSITDTNNAVSDANMDMDNTIKCSDTTSTSTTTTTTNTNDTFCVNDIITRIKSDLTNFKDFDSTDFGKDAPKSQLENIDAIDLTKIIVPVNLNECSELAKDAAGNKIKLNSAQLESVRKNGTLAVDSKISPGLQHVWQLSYILQKGTQPTKESFLNEIALFYDQLFIQILIDFTTQTDRYPWRMGLSVYLNQLTY